MDQLRSRTLACPPEIRDHRRLCFYAAVFGQPTTVYDFLPGSKERTAFTEVVRPGAFSASLADQGVEIVANIDHDNNRIFARRSRNELLLQEDKHGLFASTYLRDGELEDSIIRDVENEVFVGASFRSRIDGTDQWDGRVLQVVSAPLVDVCITGNPAYKGTDVKLRTDRLAEYITRLRLLKLKK